MQLDVAVNHSITGWRPDSQLSWSVSDVSMKVHHFWNGYLKGKTWCVEKQTNTVVSKHRNNGDRTSSWSHKWPKRISSFAQESKFDCDFETSNEALVLDQWIQIEVLEITRDQAGCGRLAMFASRAHLFFSGEHWQTAKTWCSKRLACHQGWGWFGWCAHGMHGMAIYLLFVGKVIC